MSGLVGNPEDTFCRVMAHMTLENLKQDRCLDKTVRNKNVIKVQL